VLRSTPFIILFLPIFCFSQYETEDWEERDSWMGLDVIFEKAGLTVGMTVADIGCHEGYLSIHLAERVGSLGKVYSEDINENRLRTLDQTLIERKISNVSTILGDYDDPKLPKDSFDLIFIVDTYHEIYDYKKVLGHVREALKNGGKLLLLEKLKDKVRGKSRQNQAYGHSLAPKYVRQELKDAGFEVIDQVLDHGDWENNPEKQIWFIVAKVTD
jgi:ubiquinone/menaquinone biosynthesis C-methylase UbiE